MPIWSLDIISSPYLTSLNLSTLLPFQHYALFQVFIMFLLWTISRIFSLIFLPVVSPGLSSTLLVVKLKKKKSIILFLCFKFTVYKINQYHSCMPSNVFYDLVFVYSPNSSFIFFCVPTLLPS